MTDLYSTLGVTSAATAAQIKAAYRALAKKHHPDTGGDPEAFRAIQRAYDVLSDIGKRKAYDETGTIDEAAEENADAPAISMLGNLLATLLGRQELWTGDLLAELHRALDKGQRDTQNKIVEVEHQLIAIEKVKARLKRKPKSNTTFATLLELLIRSLQESIAGGKAHAAMLARAAELLDGYSMDPDPAHGAFTQATLAGMMNSTNSSGQTPFSWRMFR